MNKFNPTPQQNADLVRFTEEILNEKLHFWGSAQTYELSLMNKEKSIQKRSIDL